jgi:hypothetical protein
VIVPEYTPGDWYAVVANGVVLLLAPSTPPEVVRDVWASAPERGAGLGAQLDALVRHGIGGLHPFAAVDLTAGQVQTALRGDVEVEVVRGTRAEVLTAPQVVSWSERSVGAAEEVTIRVSGASRGGALPIVSGVVRASRVRVRLTGAEPAVEAAAPASSEPVVLPAAPTAVAGSPRAAESPEPVAEPAPAAPALPVAAAEADPGVGTEVVEGGAAPAEVVEGELVEAEVVEAEVVEEAVAVPAQDAPDDDVADGEVPAEVVEHDEVAPAPAPAFRSAPAFPAPAPTLPGVPGVPEATDVPAAREPFVPPAPPAPALPGPASADDHDGLTILSGELASIRQHLPSWAVSQTGDWPSGPVVPTPAPAPGPFGATPLPAGAPQAAGTTHAPVPRLALSTGALVPVDGVVLIGRAPQADRAPDGAETRLVTVPSPEQDISRTHAEVRLELGRVLVTDLYSTNGITVAGGGLPPRRITAGEPVAVSEGDVVDLGDGVTFTVEPGA